jgi:hypothetical protein
MMTNDICCYVDTSLLGQMETWKLNNNSITNSVVVSGSVTTSGNEAAGEDVQG